jgi:hypothetical protein
MLGGSSRFPSNFANSSGLMMGDSGNVFLVSDGKGIEELAEWLDCSCGTTVPPTVRGRSTDGARGGGGCT